MEALIVFVAYGGVRARSGHESREEELQHTW